MSLRRLLLLFKSLNMVIATVLQSLFSASAILNWRELASITVLIVYDGDILPWLIMFIPLCWCLGIYS